MKKAPLLIAAFICTLQLMAQPPAGNSATGTHTFVIANNGHVFGKVVDSSGAPISEASVIVLQGKFDSTTRKSRDLLIKGTSTSGNGEFSIEDLPVMGKLKLAITGTGYKEWRQDLSFGPTNIGRSQQGKPPAAGEPGATPIGGSSEKDLGKIKLTAEIKELKAVTVTTTKSLMRLDIDKKVFNVDKNIVSDGGTAVDVMKNVPSVNVDIDGNVSLRNSAPQIYVDGRPTSLTLEQIPANTIESVEVMTNPSAKYEASGGGAGILNIVLKKNKKTGYNGNVRVGVNKYGETDAGADFNVRQGKINFNAGVNARAMSNRSTGTTDRTNLTTTPVTQINQVNTDRTTGNMLFGRAGLDYFMTNKTTLSLSGVRMHGNIQPRSVQDINIDSVYSTGTLLGYSQRNTSTQRLFDAQGLVFGMKQLFLKPGEELTIDANYFSARNSNNALYTTNNYYNGKGSDLVNSVLQKIAGGGSDENLVLQTDYVKPFNSSFKLETGVRAAFRSRINTNSNYTFDNATNAFILIPSAASNYQSNDHVYAGYVSATGSIKNFGYKVGLRAESSDYSGQLAETKQTFSNKYPISLFPSVFVSQKLGNNQELQLSYTKRINRPNFFQLIPFTDSTDKLNITMGNPNLLPEFTQSLEMNYLKQFLGNNTFLASVYYKKTNNLITNYLSSQTDPINGHTTLVNTFINANSSYRTGAEFTLQNNFTKWWSTSTDINIYNSKINIDNVSSTPQAAMTSWFGKLNNTFKLPSNFSVQLSGMYQSKTNLPVNTNQGGPGGGPGGGGPPGMAAQSSSQGYIKPFYSVDIAVKKTFLNNKASVSLSVNDLFRSRKQNQYSYSDYFTQEYNRIRDSQMIRLNFGYSFGKIDALLFKRKSQGTGQTGTESMQ